MQPCVLSIDQGTTGTTAVLYDVRSFQALGQANIPFKQIFPEPGLVEHDAEEIWSSVLKALSLAQKNAAQQGHIIQIVSVAVTNQRETVVCFDRKTGKPLAHAIVWQDRRTAEFCKQLNQDQEFIKQLKARTGLIADPYFSATKIQWMMRNIDGIKAAVNSGQAVFGTIDSYLTHRLTGCVEFVTEPTNACRTLLVNLETTNYDETLLDAFEIPQKCLPQIKDSVGLFGFTKGVPGLADGIAIEGVLGDQQAALFGQGAFAPGQAKVTFGTGAFLLMNTGTQIVRSERGLLTSVAVRTSKQTTYCLEGACFIAGAAIQFLRDSLKFISTAAESDTLALSEPADENLEFVPSLAGLSAPYWNADARGVLFGLTRGTSQAQIMRCVLESIALQNVPFIETMQQESGLPLQWLGVDGGAAQNNYLMQFQADMLQTKLRRPSHLEATSLGAARAAWSNQHPDSLLENETLKNDEHVVRIFHPTISADKARARFKKWLRAAEAVHHFYS